MAKIKIYGSVKLVKSKCNICKKASFGAFCCDPTTAKIDPKITVIERVSRGVGKRQFSRAALKEAIQKQENKCFWCRSDFAFGFYITKRGNLKALKPVGDHLIPFSYSQNTATKNLIASCNVCNSIKASKIFDTEDAMRSFILERRSKKLVSGAEESAH